MALPPGFADLKRSHFRWSSHWQIMVDKKSHLFLLGKEIVRLPMSEVVFSFLSHSYFENRQFVTTVVSFLSALVFPSVK